MSSSPADPHAIYVKAAAGKPVARYGTTTLRKGNDVIGGRYVDDPDRRPDPITGQTPRKLEVNPDMVVMISGREAQRFRREYARAFRAGSLEKVTRADYEAWIKLEEEAGKAALEARKKRKEEAEEAERKRVAELAGEGEDAPPTEPEPETEEGGAAEPPSTSSKTPKKRTKRTTQE